MIYKKHKGYKHLGSRTDMRHRETDINNGGTHTMEEELSLQEDLAVSD
jgi:hypothetical protein